MSRSINCITRYVFRNDNTICISAMYEIKINYMLLVMLHCAVFDCYAKAQCRRGGSRVYTKFEYSN